MNARFDNAALEIPKEAPDAARPARPEGNLQLVIPEAESAAPSATGGRRPLLYVGAGVLLVALIGGAIAMLRPTNAPAPVAPPATLPVQDKASLTVRLTTPHTVGWPDTLPATGSISAWQEAMVGAEVSGLRLSQVLVDVGDQVHRGQLLARFDDATMQAALNQQKAAVAEMEANAAEADANAVRAARLRQNGALSEQNIIQYETRARAARAQVESAQARLQSGVLALQYTKVVAPDDGVISSRNAMLGSVASPGSELFRLVRQNRIEWRAEVPAAQLALVKPGQKATIQLQDGSSVTGDVRQVAPVLNENTRIGLAYVELDHANVGHARPGMYASGTITLGERPALTLPSSAIVQRDGHQYVFGVGADKHVLQTKITTGRRYGSDVEVLSGITKDTPVVLSGAPFLNDGDVVRIDSTAPAAQEHAAR